MDPITLFALAALALPPLDEGRPGTRLASVLRAMVHERPRADGPEVRFEAADRQVSNWREQAADRLEPGPLAGLAALLDPGRPLVTRCVKLNNYWCIKSARWTGELGTDAEGHVGFSSAEHGAAAAATLLRRYYVDFGRRSAADIVRRWAPAECGGGTSLIAGFALRGIGGTLRARYLASRRRTVKLTTAPGGRRVAAARVSVVIPRALPTIKVPDIAVGVGERAPASASAAAVPQGRSPRVGPVRVLAGGVAPAPAPAACVPDEQRVRNYAARIGASVGLRADDDLKLFGLDGAPTANLAPVMLAMSSVELGVLRAAEALVAAAVARLSDTERERPEPPPDPPAP